MTEINDKFYEYYSNSPFQVKKLTEQFTEIYKFLVINKLIQKDSLVSDIYLCIKYNCLDDLAYWLERS